LTAWYLAVTRALPPDPKPNFWPSIRDDEPEAVRQDESTFRKSDLQVEIGLGTQRGAMLARVRKKSRRVSEGKEARVRRAWRL
jgi:hypothetical protein